MKCTPQTLRLFGLGLSFWIGSPAAFAAGETMGLAEVTQGTLLFKTEKPGAYAVAPTQQTEVEMRVTGPIVRTEVTQRFTNPGDQWSEAIYAFPLPEEAAVDRLTMKVGDRVVEGKIMENTQAKQTYEAARRKGQRSALVEQHRPNLFTTSVANIPPRGEVEVRIEYQDLAQWRNDGFSLRYPMAVTPRYRPRPPAKVVEEDIGLNDGWAILPGEIPNAVPIDSATNSQDALLNPVSMHVVLNSGFPLASVLSPSHDIRSDENDEGVTEIRFSEGQVAADRDFILQWQPTAGQVPRAAFFTEHTETGGYALMMVMPPAPDGEYAEIPRELILVIDTSGSMGGASIRQARAALRTAIEHLAPGDLFNVIQFNSSSHALFRRSLPATHSNRRLALDYVDGLDANGGTELHGALRKSFELSRSDEGVLTQILFVTDGAVSNEAELLSYIHQALGERRLFTVGIGSAPNSHFMTEAAYFGRGDHTYIGRVDEVQSKMEIVLGQLERPALTDIQLTVPNEADILPNPIPDLYAGEPIVAVMQLPGDISQIDISGRLGDTLWKSHLSASTGGDESVIAGLGVHWARQKIQHWMRSQVRGEDPEQVRERVLQLALDHHLVSQYTSLVAVDATPVRPQDEIQQHHALKGNLPAGWEPSAQTLSNDQAVQLTLAQGSTSSVLSLALGTLLLIAAASVGVIAPARPRKVTS